MTSPEDIAQACLGCGCTREKRCEAPDAKPCRRSGLSTTACSWCCNLADVLIERVGTGACGVAEEQLVAGIVAERGPTIREVDEEARVRAVVAWLVGDGSLRRTGEMLVRGERR